MTGRSDPGEPLRLAVIGGGFTGAVLVMNAVRATVRPLDITIVEPAPMLGRGIAYGTPDPAHRINVPADRMSLFKDDPGQVTRWLNEQGILPDPASEAGDGHVYVPRHAYGSFIADTLRRTIDEAGSRVRLSHRRTTARGLAARGKAWTVELDEGGPIGADLVALCFGHAVPLLPCPVEEAVVRDARFVPDPWAEGAMEAIAPGDAVLVVGTGLTMADVVVSLRERGHRGPITAISRRGLLPRAHGAFRNDVDILEADAPPATALGLLRLVRRRIRESGAALGGWHPLIDAVRFKLPVLWGHLPPREKANVVRRLLPFWEVHRFRIAPQVAAALDDGLADGGLTVERAGLVGLAHQDGRLNAVLKPPGAPAERRAYDAVILCTGPDKDLRRNPLIADLLASGTAHLDALGLGLSVDGESRVLDGQDRPRPGLLALGPMTRGTFGEMTGAPDIAKHIETLSAGLFGEKAAAPPESRMSQTTHHVVPDAAPPPPSSLYAHAVQADGWLHVTGQLPTDPDDPAAALRPGVEAQSELCFENIRRILRHAGFTLDDAVFVRIYLTAFERDFSAFNSVYVRHFPQDRRLPSRTTVGVAALGRSALVEIDMVCFNAARR